MISKVTKSEEETIALAEQIAEKIHKGGIGVINGYLDLLGE